jgi:acetyl esterase/lipase
MASLESKQIRATFRKDQAPGETTVQADRHAWERAVESVNRTLDVAVTPVAHDALLGEWVTPSQRTEAGVVLFLHGGGYNAGSPRTHRALAAHLAQAAHMPVFLPEYRLAPEHPFPAAVEDAAAAYLWLLQQEIPAQQIVIGGDSAGAGLAAATLVKLRDDGTRLPAGAFLLSPWVDLALTGASIHTRAALDPLTTYHALHRAARYYVHDHDVQHPLASPLYADLTGLPPLLIHVGDHELLLNDATRLADQARAVGVAVDIEVWNEMWHVWHAWADELPEARAALATIAAWIEKQLAMIN